MSGHNRGLNEAQRIAWWYRLHGYPDAEPAEQYCLYERHGNWVTLQAEVYLGERRDDAPIGTLPGLFKRLLRWLQKR